MRRAIFATSVLAIAIVVLASSQVQASVLSSEIRQGNNVLNDRDRERLVGSADTLIDVGEILEAILIFDNLDNSAHAQEDLNDIFGPSYQLTAHVRLLVDTVTPTTPGRATFTFTGGFADGSLAKLYEDTTGQDTSFGTLAATTITNATDTPLVLSLGLVDATDFWRADGPIDIALIGAAGTGEAAAFNFGLSILVNTDLPIKEEAAFSSVSGDFHDVVGFGQAFALASNPNGWDAGTDTTVSFIGIPEPAAIVTWLGLTAGAVTFAVSRRKLTAMFN